MKTVIENKNIYLFVVLIVSFSICVHAQNAPSFALLNNQDVLKYSSEYKGNLIISFFASYCVPCKKEIPLLVELENRFGKSKNLTLVLINTDQNDSSCEAKIKAQKFLREINIDHEYLLDIYQKTIKKYNPKKNVPCTFLINSSGNIIFSQNGFSADMIEKIERAILANIK